MGKEELKPQPTVTKKLELEINGGKSVSVKFEERLKEEEVSEFLEHYYSGLLKTLRKISPKKGIRVTTPDGQFLGKRTLEDIKKQRGHLRLSILDTLSVFAGSRQGVIEVLTEMNGEMCGIKVLPKNSIETSD
jgi:predicted metal-dependent hydrolase